MKQMRAIQKAWIVASPNASAIPPPMTAGRKTPKRIAATPMRKRLARDPETCQMARDRAR
jgi:hypothetical protein